MAIGVGALGGALGGEAWGREAADAAPPPSLPSLPTLGGFGGEVWGREGGADGGRQANDPLAMGFLGGFAEGGGLAEAGGFLRGDLAEGVGDAGAAAAAASRGELLPPGLSESIPRQPVPVAPANMPQHAALPPHAAHMTPHADVSYAEPMYSERPLRAAGLKGSGGVQAVGGRGGRGGKG